MAPFVRPGQRLPRPPPGRIPSALDNSLLHAIETIIIDWAHQVRDVLSKDSAQALLDGLQPLPRVEFEFWDARLMNLKCIHDQVPPLLPGTREAGKPVTALSLPPARAPASAQGLRVAPGTLIYFSPSQLNRPKVNKIVEILEKAKSCYWPALQNVYLNVTEGEWGEQASLTQTRGRRRRGVAHVRPRPGPRPLQG